MNAQREHEEAGRETRAKLSHASTLIYGEALSECLKRAYDNTSRQDDESDFSNLLSQLDQQSL